jgi:hypothetical protein
MNGGRTTGKHLEEDTIRSIVHTIHKYKFQMDLNVKKETIQILEKQKCEFFYNMGS